MANFQTHQLKPNPTGKDRNKHGRASARQLGGEWVDLKNISDKSVNITGVKLCHIAYSGLTDRGRWEEVTSFSRGVVAPGGIVRVHSGSGPENALSQEDLIGADHHVFTNKDRYVWNNDRGDCSALFMGAESDPFDKACYDSGPPEGVILERVGDKLVARSAVAGRR